MALLKALILLTIIMGIAVALDVATLTDIRSRVRTMIDDDAVESGNARNKRMIGGLVRLSFHDCVGPRCDGCINKDNHENAGLEVYINRTELLYAELLNEGIQLSRADFWAIAGSEAVYYAAEFRNNPTPEIQFYTGRTDCDASPWTTDVHEFPSALGDTRSVVKFFRNQFNFNQRKTAAILGAHTLGRAHRTASGFNHPWVPRQDRFDNQFYINLKNGSMGWHQVGLGNNREPKVLWESQENVLPVTMMLNSDMALIKDLGTIDEFGWVQCEYNTCPETVFDTAYWANEFANDNALFIHVFSETFQEMISHGYLPEDLELVQ